MEHSNGVNSEVCAEMQKENCSFSIMNKVLFPCWASVSLTVKRGCGGKNFFLKSI